MRIISISQEWRAVPWLSPVGQLEHCLGAYCVHDDKMPNESSLDGNICPNGCLHQSVHPSSGYPFGCPSIHQYSSDFHSACLPTCLPTYLSIHPSVRPSVHPSVRPSIHPSIRPSIIHPSIHLSIYLFIYLSIYLRIYLISLVFLCAHAPLWHYRPIRLTASSFHVPTHCLRTSDRTPLGGKWAHRKASVYRYIQATSTH